MNDHECPELESCAVYEGETEDAMIAVQEVYAPQDTVAGRAKGGVAIYVATDTGTGLINADPELALEIAAGIAEAAHVALMRRDMGW